MVGVYHHHYRYIKNIFSVIDDFFKTISPSALLSNGMRLKLVSLGTQHRQSKLVHEVN